MKEPRWCTAWMGARKKEDDWQWVDSGEGVPKKYFAANEFDNTDEGRGYGSFMPLGQTKQSPSDQDGRGLLYNTQNLDWSVHGYIIERQAIFSSTYTLNGWAVSDHPRMKDGVPNHFYRGMEEGGSEAPLFSEGTGPVVMPMESNRPAKDLEYGGQTGQGLSRLCIDRYHNGANNVAFMDGSVDSVKLADLWKLKWHKQWKAPSRLPRVPGE
jgi:prepilin-type processing-associated H-X9-DG protein